MEVVGGTSSADKILFSILTSSPDNQFQGEW